MKKISFHYEGFDNLPPGLPLEGDYKVEIVKVETKKINGKWRPQVILNIIDKKCESEEPK